MDKHKYAIAIDIGASSGRHLVGWYEGSTLKTKEVYRFPNSPIEENGILVWDIDSLERNVKLGIEEALKQFPSVSSLAIDTWGVDYVLMDGDKPIYPCVSYRNGTTDDVVNEVHSLIPFEQLYSRTGTQFQRFNSIYQLYRDKKAGKLDKATDFLLVPEYLMYRLCGVKFHEYTNATTTGLINCNTGEYDSLITKTLGLPDRLFSKLTNPGEVVGTYKNIKCFVCATHDTASAIYAIPMDDDVYISSGTWSLLGVKTDRPVNDSNSMKDNFTNEGGIGYNRYLKNIMGMWMVNNLKNELCPEKTFEEIVNDAESSTYKYRVDAQSEMFLSPKSMKAAFDQALEEKGFPKPDSCKDYFYCAFNSLAQCYADTIKQIEQNTGKKYKKIFIVGGGAKNRLLNTLTEKITGKKVVALPIEATSMGNLAIQLRENI